MSVKKGLHEYRESINAWKREIKDNLKERKALQERLDSAGEHVKNCLEAQKVIQDTSKELQTYVHSSISGLVSECLSTVFEKPYKFQIEFVEKRGKTEAELFIEHDGNKVDPMTASGGGIVDIASFALRLACIVLSRPPLRRLLVLDEPFKFVSKKYRQNIVELLNRLSEELDVQIIMVTHIPEIEIGDIIEI